jgi:hypothetical protein
LLEPLANPRFVHKAERQMNGWFQSGSSRTCFGGRSHYDMEAIMIRSIAAALTVLLLAGSTALPAQAQSARFGIFFGDEASDFYPELITCLNNYQIREAVAGRGYTDIALNVPMQKHIEVRATRDGWVYLLDFNYCTGHIEGRTQLRRAG